MTSTPVSRAIPIVAPAESPTPSGRKTPQSPTKRKDEIAGRTLCKNVIIYGSCRNEGKGCTFAHPPRDDVPATPTFAAPIPTGPFARVQSPSFSSVNINAPVFVPRGVTAVLSSATERSIDTPPPDPGPSSTQSSADAAYNQNGGYDGGYTSNFPEEFGDLQLSEEPVGMLDYGGYAMPSHDPSIYSGSTSMMMGPDPFYAPSYPLRPLNYHLYAQASPPYASTLRENRLFISDTLREDLQKRSEALSIAPPPPGGLPEEVHTYHSLVPLENAGERRKFFAGWNSIVYKAVNRKDGQSYALRRVEGFRLLHEASFGAIEKWSAIVHPNIVQIKEAFTSRAFNDHSLVFIYEYHPTAQTLYSMHLAPKASSNLPTPSSSPPQSFRQASKHMNGRGAAANANGSGGAMIPERIMWSYIIQIANAIKAVHDQGMAVRILDVSKILVVGKNRIRINCCGIFDVVAYNPALSVELMQLEDLLSLGKLIYILGCSNANALNAAPKAIEMLMRSYSPDLNNLAYFLISKPTQRKTIDDVLTKIGPKLLTAEMNAIQSYADDVENQLMGELENARLVRLLCKFGFINERPDFTHELRWSETGDRYIIKLFRDYVFHQVDEMGNPLTNMGHVLMCLNKLDAGTDERIMLVSRDEQSCLVVSYKEIKACIEQAFSDLSKPPR